MSKQIYLECLREDLRKSEVLNREIKQKRWNIIIRWLVYVLVVGLVIILLTK